MNKPSDGALRAADTAMSTILNSGLLPEQKWTVQIRDRLAEIIDRETGLPELIEALKCIDEMEAGSKGAYKKFAECVSIARNALAKAKGEQ